MTTATLEATTTPPAPGAYWPGQGGIYIGTMPACGGLPACHLIAAEDTSPRLEWGGYGHRIPGADSQYDGRANTAALLASEHNHPAAKWANVYTRDGLKDFYLPARNELMFAWIVAPEVFSKQWHWTSTQDGAHFAVAQSFENGTSDWTFKDDELLVRPVRSIQL